MKLTELIQQIEELKQQIDAHGKLPEEVLKKVNYKFRLDWNYYSNRMEGGTLTREETRSVMIGNVSVEGKPLRDLLEMKGHDDVVREILNIGTGERRISERRIKEVHKAIITEEDNADMKKQIGKWKEQPNEIINYKGEKFEFASPEEVAEKMHTLLNNVNAKLDAFFAGRKDAQHPLFIASDFHLDYLSIHPFFDGNGRTARIFTNLILIACGYPPVIIKDEEKQGYYKTLADIQAYGGDRTFLYSLMGKVLLRSLELVKDAIEGKDIEDSKDLDKRLELHKILANNKNPNSILKLKKDMNLEHDVQRNIIPLIKALWINFQKVHSLFTENDFTIAVNGNRKYLKGESVSEENILDHFEDVLKDFYEGSELNNFSTELYHRNYKAGGVNAFHVPWELNIRFESTRFEIYLNRSNQANYKKLYHQTLSSQEVDVIAEQYLKYVLDEIDQNLERINNFNDAQND